MRRWLWIVFGAAVLANLALAAVLVTQMRYGSGFDEDLGKKKWLVEIRKAIFSDYTDDLALLSAGPEEIAARGFAVDSPEEIDVWARSALPSVPYLAGVAADSLPTDAIERAKAIALRFSKNGGPGCGHFRDLQDNLEHIAEGEGQGCCADHAQAMIALGQAYGLVVRQVGHANHTFNEIWDPERGKWVFLDPQYALVARDENGAHLGLLEIRERLRDGRPFEYEFFGNDHHEFSGGDPNRHVYYRDFAAFRDARFVWGSNVLAQDRLERRLAWMPKAVRQAIGFGVGVFPPMKLIGDGDAALPETYRRRRLVIFGSAALLAAGTLLPPALLLATRGRRATRA